MSLLVVYSRARTSYVFKFISLTKDSSEQDTRELLQVCISETRLTTFKHVLDSPQHLQRSFLCCYAWRVSVRLLSSSMSTTTAPTNTRRAAWRSFCCLPARTWGVSSRRRFEIRPLSPIVRRTLLQHLIVARRV